LNLKAAPNATSSGSITISNMGSGPLTANVTPSTLGAPFSETGGGSTIVIPGAGSHEVIVTYSPTAKGKSKTSVTITSDDPHQKKAIKVSVQGTAK
jgi:hypothetical protein